MNAIVYARYSSDNQREESIQAQLRIINDYARKNDIYIVAEYIDEATSATSDKREQFQQIFEDIGSGIHKDIELLLVHKLDRFARNRYDSAMYRRKLAQHNIKLFAVDQPLGDSPEDKLLEGLLESMNEFYSLNLSREVMKGMTENAISGKHTGGKPPLGYNVNQQTKQLEINECEASAVRMIFDMYTFGNSYSEIIKSLNAAGHKTKIGRKFAANSLHAILINQKYCGTYVFNRSAAKVNGKRNNHTSKSDDEIIKIPGIIPAIVSHNQFESAQKMIARRRKVAAEANAHEVYLLSGLLRCELCGGAMSGSKKRAGRNKEIYYAYECSNRKRLKSCTAKSVNRDHIEKRVIEKLYNELFSDDNIKVLLARANEKYLQDINSLEREFTRLKNELNGVLKQIDNITAAIADGMYNSSMKDKMNALEQRKLILNQSIGEMVRVKPQKLDEEQFKVMVSRYRQRLESQSREELKMTIHDFITELTYNPDTKALSAIVTLNGGGGAYCCNVTIA